MDQNDIRQDIPLVKAGDRIGASYFNSIANAVNNRRGSVNPPSQVFPKTGGSQQGKQFKVVTEYDDYLGCKSWDGTTLGSTLVNVAKPPLMRKTKYDGLTIDGISYVRNSVNTRTATRVSDSVTQSQKITQDYLTNAIIYAVTNVAGGVDCTDGTNQLVWLDLNVDGRAWAEV
jgi:hypothetical protein